MQVLIAEDDPVTRLTLSAAVKGLGHDVTAAEDGAEAWELLQVAHFPVIVSDWQMPGLEGVELCRRLAPARTAATCTSFW